MESGLKATLPILTGCVAIALIHNTSDTVNFRGTRFLDKAAKKEVSVIVRNPFSAPYLIEAVVKNLNNDVHKSPHLIILPFCHQEGGKENLKRLVIAGTLPQDKESMYRLRVKAIPFASKENKTLQIAAATSIKPIYRPDALKDAHVEKQSDKLKWHVTGERFEGLSYEAYSGGRTGIIDTASAVGTPTFKIHTHTVSMASGNIPGTISPVITMSFAYN